MKLRERHVKQPAQLTREPQAQMKTIDEQLEDALARVKQLEADARPARLLTEARNPARSPQQVATLTAEKAALAKEKKPSPSPTTR